MKKIVLLFCIALLYGCEKDLTGFWKGQTEDDVEIAFHIKKDRQALLYFSQFDDPIKGEHFPSENELFFPGECGIYSFEYRIEKDHLKLTNALGTEVIVKRLMD